MTVITGPTAADIADALTQVCPRDPAHRIRPIEVDLRRVAGPVRQAEARLLGICAQCWPAEITLLEDTVPVDWAQVRDWALDWLTGGPE
jgi:hypothetical protein